MTVKSDTHEVIQKVSLPIWLVVYVMFQRPGLNQLVDKSPMASNGDKSAPLTVVAYQVGRRRKERFVKHLLCGIHVLDIFT